MAAVSRRFANAPEKRQRPLHDSGDVLAPSLITQVEAERRIDHMVEGGLVEPARDGLFFVERLCLEPGRDTNDVAALSRCSLRSARIPNAALRGALLGERRRQEPDRVDARLQQQPPVSHRHEHRALDGIHDAVELRGARFEGRHRRRAPDRVGSGLSSAIQAGEDPGSVIRFTSSGWTGRHSAPPVSCPADVMPRVALRMSADGVR
jgi:hypothetical protein